MPDQNQIEIEHVYRHPPERVFAAWTTAAQLARWMCPGGATVVEAIADPRVGGEFRVVMDVGTAHPIVHEGHYVTVNPPHLIELTWRSVNTGGRVTLLSISLAVHPAGTRLTLTHRDLPPPAVDAHRLGWESILVRLEASLAESVP